MGRYDYDDMPTKNTRRGRKGNRATALMTFFFILVALIIIVIYLIANPSEKVDIVDSGNVLTQTKKNEEEKKPLVDLTQKRDEEIESDNSLIATLPLVNDEYPVYDDGSSSDLSGAITEEPVENESSSTIILPIVDELDNSSDSSIQQSEETIEKIDEVESTQDNTPAQSNEPLLDSTTPDEPNVAVTLPLLNEELPVVVEPVVEEEVEPVNADYSFISVPLENNEEENAIINDEVSLPKEETSVVEEEDIVAQITPIVDSNLPLDDNSNTINDDYSFTTLPLLTEERSVVVEEENKAQSPLESIDSSLIVPSSSSLFDGEKVVITSPSGSPIKSIIDGTVTKLGRENGQKYVVVTDSDGDSYIYSGFERVIVKKNSRIKEGSILGSTGSSSNTITVGFIPYDNN